MKLYLDTASVKEIQKAMRRWMALRQPFIGGQSKPKFSRGSARDLSAG